MFSFATQPTRGFAETPENASEPPHCSAIRSSESGSSVRRAAFASGSQPRTIASAVVEVVRRSGPAGS